MPDYRYLKKKTEGETEGEEQKRREAAARYHREEPEIAEAFIRRVKGRIEKEVSTYYREGKHSQIRKKGLFSHEYVLTVKGGAGYIGAMSAEIYFDPCRSETRRFTHVDADDCYTLTVPAAECLESFVKAVNRRLAPEGVQISAEKKRRNCKTSFIFNIKADLGRL